MPSGTERLLVDAGITAGLRVLDVGCGRGDVSLMAARLVGEVEERAAANATYIGDMAFGAWARLPYPPGA